MHEVALSRSTSLTLAVGCEALDVDDAMGGFTEAEDDCEFDRRWTPAVVNPTAGHPARVVSSGKTPMRPSSPKSET